MGKVSEGVKGRGGPGDSRSRRRSYGSFWRRDASQRNGCGGQGHAVRTEARPEVVDAAAALLRRYGAAGRVVCRARVQRVAREVKEDQDAAAAVKKDEDGLARALVSPAEEFDGIELQEELVRLRSEASDNVVQHEELPNLLSQASHDEKTEDPERGLLEGEFLTAVRPHADGVGGRQRLRCS